MKNEADLADLEISPFSEGLEQRRNETVSVAELISPTGVAEKFYMRGVESPDNAAHPFGGECKACLMKEPQIRTKLDQLWRQIHPAFAPGWFPVNCCDACYDEAKIDSHRLAANREFWEKVCPVEFRKDWDDRKGSKKLLARVLNFDPRLKRSMIIHGQSDSGKTRVIWRLLRKLAEEGITWIFIESIDLMDEIPSAALNVQLLVIDDLGNDTLTGPKEVRFLKLIRTRSNWHRPTIITTQFNAHELTNKFSQTATAKAVFRRLAEFSDSIDARNP